MEDERPNINRWLEEEKPLACNGPRWQTGNGKPSLAVVVV